MAHAEHDRAREQRFPDPGQGHLRFSAHHHEGQHEDGHDGGLGGEVPCGHGDQCAAEHHERDGPRGAGQQRGESREERRSEHRPERPAQHARGEGAEVRLDEKDGGHGQPVPVAVVQELRDGGTGPEAECHPDPVLAPGGADGSAQGGDGCSGAGVQRLRTGAAPGPHTYLPSSACRPVVFPYRTVERHGRVQQGLVQSAQGGVGTGRSGQRTARGRGADGVREAPQPLGRAGRKRAARPGEGRGRLGERQGGGVLRVQAAFGAGTGVPAQARPGQGVLRVVERGGQGDAVRGGAG